MNKNKITYKIFSVLLLFGMMIHLLIIHPFAGDWVMCTTEADTHFENLSYGNDCHSIQHKQSLHISSNCKDDLLLEHQDEFYSTNKTPHKKTLPVSTFIFPPEISNGSLTSHINLIRQTEITSIPLTVKHTIHLLI